MAIVINGSGTVTGLAVGGLPDGTVDAGTVAADVATQAEIDAKLNLSGGAMTGTTTHADNVKSTWGSGNDFQIYHDGTSNILGSPSGGTGRPIEIQVAGGEKAIKIINEGAVELYHDNVKKFETTATGTTVTRGLFTDGIEITDGSTEDCLKISASSSAHNLAKWTATNSSADGQTIMQFYRNGGLRGSISTSNSATAFNTSSDYRLKENVDYTWDATTRLKQLKPARFNWIADETNTLVDGFIAHEVTSVVPEAVCGAKDAVDSDGNIDAQGIDQSKLVPLLVKTIQELEARITALEA